MDIVIDPENSQEAPTNIVLRTKFFQEYDQHLNRDQERLRTGAPATTTKAAGVANVR
jgi:hypothetical protein